MLFLADIFVPYNFTGTYGNYFFFFVIGRSLKSLVYVLVLLISISFRMQEYPLHSANVPRKLARAEHAI